MWSLDAFLERLLRLMLKRKGFRIRSKFNPRFNHLPSYDLDKKAYHFDTHFSILKINVHTTSIYINHHLCLMSDHLSFQILKQNKQWAVRMMMVSGNVVICAASNNNNNNKSHAIYH